MPLEGYAKAYSSGTATIVAGGTATFPPIRVPSPPQLDDGAAPSFAFVYLFAAVTTDGPPGDLTLTGQYAITPVKNSASAVFTVTANGLTICVRQPAAPAGRLGLTIVSAGAAGHNLTVAWGAHAAPSYVDLDAAQAAELAP